MNKQRKVAIVLILIGFFLPLFLLPFSSTHPFANELIGMYNPFEDLGSIPKFTKTYRTISLSSLYPSHYIAFRLPVAFSVLLIFTGIIILVVSLPSSKK